MNEAILITVIALGVYLLWLTSKRHQSKKRIKALRLLSRTNRRAAYNLYLTTPEWRAKRKKCLAHHFNRCCRCGSPNHLECHHITYANIFDEQLSDLVPWCNDCHANYAPRSDGLWKA